MLFELKRHVGVLVTGNTIVGSVRQENVSMLGLDLRVGQGISPTTLVDKLKIGLIHTPGKGKTDTVIPSIPLVAFMEISDLENGQSGRLEQMLADLDAVAAGEAVSLQLRPRLGIGIDLGAYMLTGDDQLTVTLDLTADLVAAEEIIIFTSEEGYTMGEKPLQYVMKDDADIVSNGCTTLWGFRRSISGGQAQEVSALRKADVAWTVKGEGFNGREIAIDTAYARQSIVGMVAAGLPRQLVMILRDPSDIGYDLSVSAVGTAVAAFSFITRERVVSTKRSQAKAAAGIQRLGQRMARMETQDPMRAASMVAQGVTMSTAQLRPAATAAVNRARGKKPAVRRGRRRRR